MDRFFLALAGAALLISAGCNGSSSFIDKATVEISDNLETVKVSLLFGSKVQSNLAATEAVKDYGYLFVDPYTSSQPFAVGFYLNTKIAYDQDYVHLQPTTVLPNGMPIGLSYALVEVGSPTPISSQFDMYGYIDVLHTSWLGAAAMFKFMSDQNFPSDLSVQQVLLRDSQQNPTVTGAVFGPTLNPDGTLARAGGIAVFANVRALIEGSNTRRFDLFPTETPVIRGPGAAYYEQSPAALEQLRDRVIQGLNSAH